MADFGLTEIAAVASIAGTGLSAIGSMNQAQAQQANANYQAQVARNNQTIAAQNAQYASQAGAAATTKAQLEQRAKIGAIGAELAASGLDPNTGSPAAVKKSAAELAQLDTATTAQDAALKVYGFKTAGANYGAQAGLDQQEASQAGAAGALSAGSTLLSGFGSLASKWGGWNKPTGPYNYTGGYKPIMPEYGF
jgi:hypothetical protein